MSRLAEIEAATDLLPSDEKQELLRFLLARLPVEDGKSSEPRTFSREEIDGWIVEDEADMRRFHEGV